MRERDVEQTFGDVRHERDMTGMARLAAARDAMTREQLHHREVGAPGRDAHRVVKLARRAAALERAWQTQRRLGELEPARAHGVLDSVVGQLRAIAEQEVEHDRTPGDRKRDELAAMPASDLAVTPRLDVSAAAGVVIGSLPRIAKHRAAVAADSGDARAAAIDELAVVAYATEQASVELAAADSANDLSDAHADILEELPESVASGRTLAEIAEARDRTWQSHRMARTRRRPAPRAGPSDAVERRAKPPPAALAESDLAEVPGARKATAPSGLAPSSRR